MRLSWHFQWLLIAVFIFCLPAETAQAETTPGDVTGDDVVDVLDIMTLIDWWMQDNCDEILNCFGVDISGPNYEPDGIVNYYDFVTLSANWLVGIENPIEEPPFPL
jgi:hypothetical protein